MKKVDGTIIGTGLFIAYEDCLVGYVDIGNYNKNGKAVYVRQAIDRDKREKIWPKSTFGSM